MKALENPEKLEGCRKSEKALKIRKIWKNVETLANREKALVILEKLESSRKSEKVLKILRIWKALESLVKS